MSTEQRLLEHLGVDPAEVKQHTVKLTPIRTGYLIEWDGILVVDHETYLSWARTEADLNRDETTSSESPTQNTGSDHGK